MQGIRRPEEDIVAAAQRYAEEVDCRQQEGRRAKHAIDMTGDAVGEAGTVKEKPDQGVPLIIFDDEEIGSPGDWQKSTSPLLSPPKVLELSRMPWSLGSDSAVLLSKCSMETSLLF